MSGPPNAMFVMKSSGIGRNLSSLPWAEMMEMPVLGIQRFGGAAELVHAGRRVQVPLRTPVVSHNSIELL